MKEYIFKAIAIPLVGGPRDGQAAPHVSDPRLLPELMSDPPERLYVGHYELKGWDRADASKAYYEWVDDRLSTD